MQKTGQLFLEHLEDVETGFKNKPFHQPDVGCVIWIHFDTLIIDI